MNYKPLLGVVASFVLFADAQAIAVAEKLDAFGLGSNGAGPRGQSFTTLAGSPVNNVTFNFFSDGPTTDDDGNPVGGPASTPYAFGTGILLDTEYLGKPEDLGSSSTGYLGTGNAVGNFYVFDPSVILNPNTKYFFYTTTSFPAFSLSGGSHPDYDGGLFYSVIGENYAPCEPGESGPSFNFRVIGDAVAGVPDTGTTAFLLGLSFLGILLHRRFDKVRSTNESA